MYLLELRNSGKFLYEVLPNEFPEQQLTETEIILWEMYYKEKEQG